MPIRRVHLGIAAALVVALHATLLFDISTVRTLLYEDGPFEYLGALSLFVAALLFGTGYFRLRRTDPAATTGIWKRRSLLLLCLVFLFGAGEEISWGQRILGIATPEDLADANVQQEFNVHNLAPVTGLSYQLFLIGWYTFVLAIPLVAAFHEPSRRRLRRLVPIVPLSLAGLFVFNYVVSQAALFVFPILSETRAQALDAARILDGFLGEVLAVAIVTVYPINRFPKAEVQELIISLLAVLTAWTVLKMLPRGAGEAARAQNRERAESERSVMTPAAH